MKKILALLIIPALIACQPLDNHHPQRTSDKQEVASNKNEVVSEKKVLEVATPVEAPSPSYMDWDATVRADIDMQNMYAQTPSKIEKPIDMYMAMALALKYNYTKRLADYESAVIKASKSPKDKLPKIASEAGYINNDDENSDLKIAWNVLDMSSTYFQSKNNNFKAKMAAQESRKVIHNLLQETRVLYWKTLSAQRLLPIIDNMNEFLTLAVDEMNIKAKQDAKNGIAPSQEELQLKRKYMNAIKDLSDLKRDLETSEVKLASLIGFHPNTTYKLVGKEYGNFDLPIIKSQLSQLEWVAITNRPELRLRDFVTNIKDVEIFIKKKVKPSQAKYLKDPQYYNRMWAKEANNVSREIFEETITNVSQTNLETLRRQRLTNIVLTQVYVAWARYISTLEDYQISQEIAYTSENIAEDITIKDGVNAAKSALEAATAIEDEVKAMKAYVKLQDALGNLYVTLGLDAIPYYMLNERISKIAIYLRTEFAKWRNGEFLPDSRPYLLDIPAKRPPVNLGSTPLLPNLKVESGTKINVVVPDEAFEKMDIDAKKSISKAGLNGDRPLPKWLHWDEKTHTLYGNAMPSHSGKYPIKVYIADDKGNVGYINFDIIVNNVYTPSMDLGGLSEGRRVKVLKRCVGSQCLDNYVEAENIGIEVETGPKY